MSETTDFLAAKISWYDSAKDQTPSKEITVRELVRIIRAAEYADQVARVRAAGTEDQKREAKMELPAVQVSGHVTDGNRAQAIQQGRFVHCGFLQLDVDDGGLNGKTPAEARAILAADSHVLSAFITPSGQGAKALFRVKPCATDTEHKLTFLAAEKYILETHGLAIDPSTKDTGRLCFVSSDGDSTWRHDPAEFVPSAPAPETKPLPKSTSHNFPLAPVNGIHGWLMEAAWHCRLAGFTEADTAARLQSYDGTLRRPLQPTEAVDAARKAFAAQLDGKRPTSVDSINGKPAIELPCPGRPLSDFAGDVGAMLAGAGIYSRGGLAFTVDATGQRLEAVDPQWLRSWAENEVSLFRQSKTSAGNSIHLRHSMSLDVARALVVAPQFLAPLPEIKCFAPVRMPIMRPDGLIELLPDGFDPDSFTLTDPTGCKYCDDYAPEMGAKAIRGALAEFPFADERSRAAAVAAMLTVFARGLLPEAATVPCFVYLANAEGSGKTTLAQLAGIPYGVCTAESRPSSEEEWQKQLLALVMGGSRLLLLDNLKGHLNSPSLEAYLTATTFSGRVLGVNKKFTGAADAVILLTGNRLTVSPDQRRRSVFVELFMQELRAEDRVFKRRLDPPAILEMQPLLLAAMWCMVRGWDKAGRPPASKINSSIPRWSETIAGIVEWAGFGNPAAPAELEDGGDTDTRDIGRLGEIMEMGREYKFGDIGELCNQAGLFERFTADLDSDGGDSIKARRGFSGVLKTYTGRFIATGKRFDAVGKGHSRRYILK